MRFLKDLKALSGGVLAALIIGLCSFIWQDGPVVRALEPQLEEVTLPNVGDDAPQTGLPEAEAFIDGKRYMLEVAATPKQAEIGLMYRTYLPKGQGMAFPFDAPREVAFWMKNTKIPLDMVFIRQGKVVNIAHAASPCVKEPCIVYPSEHVVDLVVELPAGTAKDANIHIGSHITPLQPGTFPIDTPAFQEKQ